MKKHYLIKCVLAFLLLSSVNSLFAQDNLFSGGTGTEADPYQIGTTEDLIALSLNDTVWDKFFIQTADIIFNEDETAVDWDNSGDVGVDSVDNSGFTPIGSSSFTGSFDGQDYTIYNVYIDRLSTHQGLFWNCDGATLKNIHCSGFYSDNKGESGALAGYITGNTLIEKCSVENTVTNGAGYYFSGFIGYATGGTVNECFVDATVTAPGKVYGGMFVGRVNGAVTFNNCYSKGDISGSGRYGGFSGRTAGATFNNCYAASTLGTQTDGGFIGRDESANTYSGCFYDSILVTGAAVSYGATNPEGIIPMSTTGMQTDTTFINNGWDFETIWEMNASEADYPLLSWQIKPIVMFSGGAGTEADPYQIATTEDLIALSLNDTVWSRYFIQTANIIFDEDETAVDWDNSGDVGVDSVDNSGFTPIGSTTFSGSYDGQGYWIANVYIDRSASTRQGLFKNCDNATLKNIHGTGFYSNNKGESGALVGYISGTTLIEQCSLDNTVTNSAGYYFGGFIGYATGGTVNECYVDATVTAPGKVYGGMFVGRVNGTVTFNNCYTKGDISANGRYSGFSGRTVGASFNNCYVATTLGEQTDGGFVGRDESANAYAGCFYDSILISGAAVSYGATNPAGIIAMSTTGMQTDTTFINNGWDFETIWEMDASETGYPLLKWQAVVGTPPSSDATLASITPSAGELSPEFIATTLSYELVLPTGTTEIPTITGIANDSEATVSKVDATELPGQTTITVTAEDGTTTKVYTINITVAVTYEVLCPGDKTLTDENVTDSVAVPDYTPEASTSGTWTGDVTFAQFPLAGSNVALDSIFEVIITATDTVGTQATCSFNVTVIDTTAPVITPVADQLLSMNKYCKTSVPDFTSILQATDVAYKSFSFSQTPAAGTQLNAIGEQVTVKITVEDGNGNKSDTISFKAIAVDDTNPMINKAFGNHTVKAITGCEYSLPDYVKLMEVEDYCSSDITLTQTPEAGTILSGDGDSIVVTVSVDDNNGNVVDTTWTVKLSAPVCGLSTDAMLASLTTSVGELTTEFEDSVFTYIVALPYGTTEVPAITAVAADDSASVAIEAANDLNGTTTITVTAENPAYTQVYNVSFDVNTGISENTTSTISVYPSPASTSISIDATQLGDDVTVTIIDMTGHIRAVLTELSSTISISDFAPGVYVVKAESSTGFAITRFVKE